MNTKKRKYKSEAIVFLTIILLLSTSRVFSQEKAILATTEITLKGNAEGGILTLIEIPQRNSRYVSISTQSGESSESVAMRLADIINNSNPFEWGGTFKVTVKDSSLTLLGPPGTYAFAGTETGLGIPEPPTSLSGMYDMDNGRVILNWQNPAAGFDRVFIAKYGFPMPTYSMITGSEEKYVYQLTDKKINYTYFCIIGIRDGVPSSPAAIYLSNNSQEELFGIPFTNGVAPNWQAWSLNTTPNKEFIKSHINEDLIFAKGKSYNSIETADTKPFKQVLKTPASGGTVGIWRRFLGLTPGHIYRLSARLSTLDTDPNEQGWSFSLHMISDRPNVHELTANQLAGLAALPDGKSGPGAGRIANFGPGITTNGKYETCSGDITLPGDSNSITVWLRHTGKGTSGVGFDWVKLEDITPSQ